ncbi:MAG: acyltransferase [Desulfobacteraceae bacterium]|nr:acyltransferase [Desulfobacteraceae bacterium]
MRRDHRPYFFKKAHLSFQKFYTKKFLAPQFDFLGKGFTFINPWHVEVFGSPVELGNYANVLATPDKKIRLTVWPAKDKKGRIKIGNYCLICAGVRINSSSEIIISDNCMLASSVYITDSDWHGIYNRVDLGEKAPVNIENNVWIGDSAIICKGVSVGENSIIGAGSVVVNDIPPNTIAAGNPARVVKHLDPNEPFTTRAQWFSDPVRLAWEFDRLDREMLEGNTILHWLRSVIFPAQGD